MHTSYVLKAKNPYQPNTGELKDLKTHLPETLITSIQKLMQLLSFSTKSSTEASQSSMVQHITSGKTQGR